MNKNKPIVIGVTGYPGTGKSTLVKIFKLIKCPVQNADQVVESLYHMDEIIHRIEQFFPSAVIANQVNKAALAEIVFTHPEKLKQLEQLLHPLVYEEHQRFIDKNKDQKLAVLEIPLLFETGRENICDVVIYTTCNPEIAYERVKQRGWSDKRYQMILERLLPDIHKKNKSQYIIDTSLSKVDTWHQLKSALQEICNLENPDARNRSRY
jgi:dephospho-CoA kinase